MKKLLLLSCIALLSNFVYGQSEKNTTLKSFNDRNTVVKLDLLMPAIELENRIGNYKTFLIAYQPGFVFSKINNGPTKTTVVSQFKGAARFFYNIDDRIQMGKRTDKFAGNFISIWVVYGLESSATPSFVTVGPTWGLQRNWDGVVHFAFEIGLGYTAASSNIISPFSLIGDLKLGFAL